MTAPSDKAVAQAFRESHDMGADLTNLTARIDHEWILMRAGQIDAQQPQQGGGDYPAGDVVGPCVCGSWPGGECLRCQKVTQTPPSRGGGGG